MKIEEVDITKIKTNLLQPRRTFDGEKMGELVTSIKAIGLLEPLVVVKEDGYYRIVAGERRYKACKELNYKTIPCSITDIKNEYELLEQSFAENYQRQNLTPKETEDTIWKLWKHIEYGTQKKMSEKTGISQNRISEIIRSRVELEDIKFPDKYDVSPIDVFETDPLKLYPKARRKLLRQRAKQKLKQKELRAAAERMKYEIETEDGNPKDYQDGKFVDELESDFENVEIYTADSILGLNSEQLERALLAISSHRYFCEELINEINKKKEIRSVNGV